jgi:hypothetical protein
MEMLYKQGRLQDGRYNFQIDLAMQLIDYGIRLDWKGDADNPNNDAGKPAWCKENAS